jgi:acetolactate synthase-1/2/3 large subunit
MGYGLPAAIGAKIARPDRLVIDIDGDGSLNMTIHELATCHRHGIGVKVVVINNQWLGMVRQWQELLHGERYSSSWSEALPDFVKLAEAFGVKGIRCDHPDDLDAAISEMLAYDGPVVLDCMVEKHENCFPMIPSGKAHNEMILGEVGIACAIRGPDGRAWAAVHCSVSAHHWDDARIRAEILPWLQDTANAISPQMRG